VIGKYLKVPALQALPSKSLPIAIQEHFWGWALYPWVSTLVLDHNAPFSMINITNRWTDGQTDMPD